MKVRNMRGNSGREIPNQFEISSDGEQYFQSYYSIIVKIDKSGRVYLDSDKWDYSKTTGRYRNMFLRESKAETERKIKSGEYVLANLNGE